MKARHVDYLIIGGGVAGISAAEAIRSRDQAGTIAILSAEPHLLYSRVLLPAYVKGRLPRERLFLRSPEKLADQRIEIFLGAEAIAVDAPNRRVKTAGRDMFSFEKLLVAAGGRVRDWPYGGSGKGLYRLQTIDDADHLAADIAVGKIREPLIIGSSFIALEFIEIFLARGVIPRVLSPSPRFFDRMLDEEGGVILEENFARHGVKCFFNEKIAAAEERGGMWEVKTAGGGIVRADALAAGIGLERSIGFLKNSGIALGERGVKTDEYLKTNVPGVFAAGDVAEYFDEIAGMHRVTGNWTGAVLQGARVGLNMAGERAVFRHVPSYSITNLGFQISALGECGPHLEAVTRRDAESIDERLTTPPPIYTDQRRDGGKTVPRPRPRYERVFSRKGAVAGAFLINCPEDRPHLAALTDQKTDVRRYQERLRDFAFDIRTLLRVKYHHGK